MTCIEDASPETQTEGENQEWNCHPQIPVALAPFFDLPPKWKASRMCLCVSRAKGQKLFWIYDPL